MYLDPHVFCRTQVRLAFCLLLFATRSQSGFAQIYMNTPRSGHSGTLLTNGKVLIAGGYTYRYDPVGTTSAEIYDTSTRTFSYTGNMVGRHAGHTGTLLGNGKVLIVGISGAPEAPPAELYDPATERFTSAGNMIFPRRWPTATLLQDGRVLIAGGTECDYPFYCEPRAEIYDPSTGSFAPTGRMVRPRAGHTAVLLSSGKVLLICGSRMITDGHTWFWVPVSEGEIYDPATGEFTLTGSSSLAARGGGCTATSLITGKVLIAGGETNVAGSWRAISGTELYDPADGTFASGGNMTIARSGHTATPLYNGKVLILGGDPEVAWYAPYSRSELYDPLTGTFRPLNDFRVLNEHTATTLLNGKVLVTGGYDGWGPSRVAYLYSPNSSPGANAGADQTVECGSVNGALVRLDGSGSSDPDGDPITYVWKNGAGQIIGTTAIVNGVAVPLGTSTFTLTVTDSHGDSNSDSVTITVRDTVAPTLSVTLDPNLLWPPNHKLVNVSALLSFNDTCDASPRIVLLSVTSNEPDNGQGDGDTPNDIQGVALNTDDRAFQLRAERSPKSAGRVYTATYRIRDAAGNARTTTGKVLVPLTNSKKP